MEAVLRSSSVFPNFIPVNSSYIRHPNQLKTEGKGKQSDCVQKLAWKKIKIARDYFFPCISLPRHMLI
jgi:hypothetical protein